MSTRSIRNLVALWSAWIFILLGFQAWTAMRFQVKHPDFALEWTPVDTALTYKLNKPYLKEPFMNQQVAFDSEYYLSIATVGYNDPKVTSGVINRVRTPLNYAFLPFYPYVMRVVGFPLRVFGLDPIATNTLAGVIVSVLGTLAGLIALFDLAGEEPHEIRATPSAQRTCRQAAPDRTKYRTEKVLATTQAESMARPSPQEDARGLGEAGAWRAAFYLLIFPSGFFLAMVYTEGLFVGLAFGALALLRRRQWFWAAVLAACATLTRAVGVALLIPLVMAFFRSGQWRQVRLTRQGLQLLLPLGLALIPFLAYLAWRLSPLGHMFQVVDEDYFGRQLFAIGQSMKGWGSALQSIFGNNPQTSAYYMVEVGATLLSILACIFSWRRYPEATAFSLAVIIISLTSGYPQGMHRYVLTAPVVFLFLSRVGKNPAFDRAWTILSTLLMGGMALLFAADMWAG